MYVGRIVAVGKTGRPFVAYRVSSRSFPNRVARITGVGVAIEPLGPDDLNRNPYIAHDCMRVSGRAAVVANSAHTDPIFSELEGGTVPEVALQKVLTEMGRGKDELSTPRIAGVVAGATGFLGVARADGVEVIGFGLEDNSCRLICTYEMDRVETKGHPFPATSQTRRARGAGLGRPRGGAFLSCWRPAS